MEVELLGPTLASATQTAHTPPPELSPEQVALIQQRALDTPREGVDLQCSATLELTEIRKVLRNLRTFL